jgi:trehalose 6-phosphate phosphatase
MSTTSPSGSTRHDHASDASAELLASEALGAADVDRALLDGLHRLASAERLLVAIDFDGTLAPEVDDPSRARALPAARQAVLRLLDLPATRVALVSGRAMESLEHVSDLPDTVLLVGSHGVEVRLDSDTQLTLDTVELEQVDALSEVLEGVADSIENVWIESKPAGFALHTRLATEADSRLAHMVALDEAQSEVEGLTVREGKNVLEFSVRNTTKGEALLHLKEYAKATSVFYAGDDVTDEDAFAVLGPRDFGLKSGPGRTIAEHRVNGPREVASVLSLLADFRSHESSTTEG